jgi:glycosyltransferase involved in cell wall biosynthesis
MRRNISPLRDLRCFRDTARFLRRHPFDIVHTHSSKAGITARFAAHRAHVPIIVHTIHGTPFRRELNSLVSRMAIRLERTAALRTHRLIAVADLVKQEFLDAGICAAEKIETIYSGIDFRPFDVPIDVEQTKRALTIPHDHYVVGTVGYLFEHKGHRYLIDAARHVLRVTPNVTFIIAGEGPARAQLEARIAAAGLRRNVLLLGERRDVAELLAIMDVYVQPSLAEGLGRSLTEALYATRAVVATAINAVPEVVEHERTGLLVTPRSVPALAAAINRLLADPDMRRMLGDHGRRRVASTFGADIMIERIDHLYQRLLQERRTAGRHPSGGAHANMVDAAGPAPNGPGRSEERRVGLLPGAGRDPVALAPRRPRRAANEALASTPACVRQRGAVPLGV